MASLLPTVLILGGLGLHAAGLIGATALDLGFAAAMALVLRSILRRFGAGAIRANGLALGLGAVSLAAVLMVPGVRLAPWLAIALVNGFVAYAFGRGLAPGRTTIIAQMIRITGIGPEGTEAFKRYAHGQCRAWTAFASATAVLGVLAIFAADWRDWLGHAIGLMLAFQAVWFVATHLYAQSRHGRPERSVDTLRAMARPGAWSQLEI